MFCTDRIVAWHCLHATNDQISVEQVQPIAIFDAPAWKGGAIVGHATGTYYGLPPRVVDTIAGPMIDDGAVLVLRGAPHWIASEYLRAAVASDPRS